MAHRAVLLLPDAANFAHFPPRTDGKIADTTTGTERLIVMEVRVAAKRDKISTDGTAPSVVAAVVDCSFWRIEACNQSTVAAIRPRRGTRQTIPEIIAGQTRTIDDAIPRQSDIASHINLETAADGDVDRCVSR